MAAYSSAVVRFESVGFVRETKIEFLDQIEDRLGRIVESGKPEGPSLTCRLHPQQR